MPSVSVPTMTKTANGQDLYQPLITGNSEIVTGNLTVEGKSNLVGAVTTGTSVAVGGALSVAGAVTTGSSLAVGGSGFLTQAGSINCKNALQVTGVNSYAGLSTDFNTNAVRLIAGAITGGVTPFQVDSTAVTINAPVTTLIGSLAVQGAQTSVVQLLASSSVISPVFTSVIPFVVSGTVTDPILITVNTGGYASGTVYVYPTVAGGNNQMVKADFSTHYNSPTAPILTAYNQANSGGVSIGVVIQPGYTQLYFNGTPATDMTVNIVLFTKVGDVEIP